MKIPELNMRELSLIYHALGILEDQCYGHDLHFETEDELGGTPNPEDVRKLMDIFDPRNHTGKLK